MTMTKMMTKTKTKTKTKTMAITPFPASYWQTEPLIYVDLPNLFEDPGWKSVKLPELPDPDRGRKKNCVLYLKMQNDYPEQNEQRPDIIDEKDNTSSQFMRVVMFSAASHPNTTVLFEAMVVVGAIVVMHYKNK